jgi:hypothetical protein
MADLVRAKNTMLEGDTNTEDETLGVEKIGLSCREEIDPQVKITSRVA